MFTLTREELYEKVWTTPTVRLKEAFGVSDVAIAKLCKKLNVPKPSRGYWAKLKHGQKVPRTPLPPLEEGGETTGSFRRTILQDSDGDSRSFAPRPLLPQPIPPSAFNLPRDLRSADPLVKKALAVLKTTEISHWWGEFGRMRPTANECLDVRVSKQCIVPALRIMDALIRGLTTKGFSVTLKGNEQAYRPHERWLMHANVGFDPVQFHIEEASTKVKDKSADRFAPTKYVPTGRLRLIIDEYRPDDLQGSWTIRADESTGDTLANFTAGLVATAKARRRDRIERERQHREWERAEKKRTAEAARVQLLKTNAAAWEESQRYRRYLDALRSGTAASLKKGSPGAGRLKQWLDWACRYVDGIDPVQRSVAQILSPSEETVDEA